MAYAQFGETEEAAKAKYEDYIQYGSVEGALALFGGLTGIDLEPYGDDEELCQVESNTIKSAIQAFTKSLDPGIYKADKLTKNTLAEHLMIGGLGATSVGTAAQVADEMQRWVDEADVGGSNIPYAVFPASFEDLVEQLIPELRSRGMFQEEYAVPRGTYRENFYGIKGQKHPPEEHLAATYSWKAGVRSEDHQIPT